MTEKACQPKICKSKQNGRTRLSVDSVTPFLGIRTLLPHLAEIPGKHRILGPRTSEQKVTLTPHKTTRRMHPPWTKPSAWFLTTIWRHPWQTRISIFLDVYFLQSSLISNTYPRHCCWEGGSLGRQARLEDGIELRAGLLTCDRWKKLKQGGRGGHGISSINPSKDALRGPYCVFCDNPTYSAQNYKTGPELQGTLEGHLVQSLIQRRLLFSIIYL